MAENMLHSMLLCLLLGILVLGVSGKICYQDDDYSSEIYCSGDCCGSSYNRYCCNDIANVMGGAAIVGIVIGCVIIVSIIVSIVICVICCLRKSRASTGQVIGQGGATATVVTNVTPYQTAYPQQAYSPGQPAYNPGQPMYNPGQQGYAPIQQAYHPGQAAYNGGQPAYNQPPKYPTSPADQPPPYQC